MTNPSIAHLRAAAKQARALASMLAEPEAKRGFLHLAAKWEGDAARLEAKDTGGTAAPVTPTDVP